MSTVLKLGLVVVLWTIANHLDYHAAVATERVALHVEPFVSRLDRPRCPRHNVDGKPLLVEVWNQPDGKDGMLDCEYGDV